MEKLKCPQYVLGKTERSCRHAVLAPVVSTKFKDLPWLPPPHNAALTLRNAGDINVTSLMLQRKGQKFVQPWLRRFAESGELSFSP